MKFTAPSLLALAAALSLASGCQKEGDKKKAADTKPTDGLRAIPACAHMVGVTPPASYSVGMHRVRMLQRLKHEGRSGATCG